jgi:hypothetical protein
VTFTCSDSYPGVLPPDYTFTAADNGTHTFNGLMLYTAGTHTLHVQDKASGAIVGSATVAFTAAPANRFVIQAAPTAVSGTPFDVSVAALDPFGNTDTDYQGTITFATSDPDTGVLLPADYTFTTGDNGVHTFANGVVLLTPGDQTLTITDTSGGFGGRATITVAGGPAPPSGGGANGHRAPLLDQWWLLLSRHTHEAWVDELLQG